jgi:hypothetical protein
MGLQLDERLQNLASKTRRKMGPVYEDTRKDGTMLQKL